MKSLKLFIIAIGLIMGFSSCSVINQGAYNPDRVQLNLTMEDLEYLGETEISASYSRYIGFIRKINTINNELYDGKVIRHARIEGKLDNVLNRATYKIFEDYPQAEYIVVANEKVETTRLFLGSEVSVSARVKVYKIK